MPAAIVRIAAGLAVGGAVLALAFAIAFRVKFAPILDAIRRFNRGFTNPRQLRSAGRAGASASVVHHVGRTTGTAYRTPVVAVPVDDDVLIALPYGPGADWVRNVLAAGGARLEHEGHTIALERPELLAPGVARPLFDAKEQRLQRLFGVDDVLLLRPTGGA